MQCPFKAIESSFYPSNTCKPRWTYCNHIGDYKECDCFKRHTRLVEQLAVVLKGEDNGINEE